MPIVFDPASKRIILDSASVTATELYSRSADWLALSDNAKYGAVFRQVGGDDLGGGLSIPPYFFLQGAWRVRPMEASHNLTITGNLFVDGGGVPVVNTLGAYNVSAQYTVPVQAQAVATSGGSGPTAAQIAAEVLAVLQAETIPVDVRKINAVTLTGAGTSGDPMRPA
ncbi:MAG TPA: hypothetical protein PK225_02330 [Azonexus sp.]|nr:hypothetical protein [Azonexus sp.]